MKKYQTDHSVHRIAMLVAMASVLQIAESLVPHPIPGLRLGLANMVTVTTLVLLGFRSALEVAVLRTVLSSLIIGTFMSPGFLLSFAAAIASTLIMGLFYWMSGLHGRFRFSIIGISIIGAFSHNLVQLILAYLLLVKHPGVFIFFPWLSLGSLATGWVVGKVAGGVCRVLEKEPASAFIQPHAQETLLSSNRQVALETSLVHRARPEMKILALFLLGLTVLIFDGYWVCVGALVFLSIAGAVSHTPFSFLVARVSRYLSLLAVAFLIPVIFGSTGPFSAPADSDFFTEVTAGGLFALRILVLIVASALLTRTTSPEDLTQGLAWSLSPLRFVGISQQRIAAILCLSLISVPELREKIRGAVRSAGLGKARNLAGLFPLLSRLIAGLYREAGSGEKKWEQMRDPIVGDPADSIARDSRAGQ